MAIQLVQYNKLSKIAIYILGLWHQIRREKAVVPLQLILVVTVIAAASIADNNDADNTAITTDTHYTTVFVLGERIICTLECIVCRLLVPAMEDDDNTDDNDNKEEIEEMEKEL